MLGTNRGPFLTPEVGEESMEKVDSAGGRSLTKTPTRTEKFRRHWRRFWLFYCIANVIFLAIFLPILSVAFRFSSPNAGINVFAASSLPFLPSHSLS